MPNTKTLDQLVSMLRGEIGESTNQAMGVNRVEPLYQLLRRTQRFYYLDYDWPEFIIERDEEILSGQRYYTFNSDVDYNRIFDAWILHSGDWMKIGHGIGPEHYNIFNSENDEQSDRIEVWDHYEGNQFEVWPISSVDTTLRWRCVKQLPEMNAGTDSCTLDADLIVLFAAAELLARDGKKDAPIKLQAAQQKYAQLKGRSQKKRVIHLSPQEGDPSGGRINYHRRNWGPRQ
jgi:hypothetical protein